MSNKENIEEKDLIIIESDIVEVFACKGGACNGKSRSVIPTWKIGDTDLVKEVIPIKKAVA